MSISAKKILFTAFYAIILITLCYGILVDNPQLISIVIGSGYIIYIILLKTTNLMDKNLFIIRYEKVFFLLIVLIITIIQLSIIEVKKSYPITLMFLVLLVLGYIIFSWIHEKMKTIKILKNEKLQSELLFLKSQINPHFFFNTLNNLYGLSIEKSDDTPKVLLKLSEVMRYTIYDGKKERVSLKSEIQNLKNYIDLHKIHHFDKLNVNFKMKTINEDVIIAPLLLINLLENAFKHGVEILRENAYINICIKTTANKLEFDIENNYFKEANTSESGIGLDNLKRRLELIYPNKYSIKIIDKNNTFTVKLAIELL